MMAQGSLCVVSHAACLASSSSAATAATPPPPLLLLHILPGLGISQPLAKGVYHIQYMRSCFMR
jgi:hypothetical protein